MTMSLEIDPDVRAIAEFMQANFAATKLVTIAEALSALAPILWGCYGREAVTSLKLIPAPIFPDDQRTRSTASECGLGQCCVDGGSAGAAARLG